MSRRKFALRHIDLKKNRGLEIGPLDTPLLSKKEANIFYVDHMSLKDLQEKYKDDPVPLDKITPPDYVVGSKTLKETLKGKKFDYVIAAHVIEHIPDTVRWLQDVNAALKPGGILSLVIPDKRYTFDITRNVSRPADIIGAYLDKHTRAPSAAMYDFVTECRDSIDASDVQANKYKDYSKAPHYFTKDVANQKCLDNLVPGEYVDSHCHVFTPYSFFEILRELMNRDLLGFEVASFDDTPAGSLEFYVSLRKVESAQRKSRLLPSLPKPKETRELEAEIEGLRTELKLLKSSKSWKITKPLRAVKKLPK
jgi:SAM-dependent methyltransferase